MTLYSEFVPKQRRSIKRDLGLLCSLKGFFTPKTIDDLEELGLFPPRIKVNKKEFFFSKQGKEALRRISDFISQSKKYSDFLNYNDIFKEVILEIERWINDDIVPNDLEFIEPLDKIFSKKVDDYTFVCKVDGLSLDGVNNIIIGNKEIKKYDQQIIADLTDDLTTAIAEEYTNSIIISGSERGSRSVAQEKFYHNAELSLSVLRLYSCALYSSAIYQANILLINDCGNSYGRASSFGWRNDDKSLSFTRYLKSKQDFEIGRDLIESFKSDYFFTELISVIGKKNKNELENAVSKSLFWIGEAQKERSHASVWVKLWSCVECFFVFGEEKVTERNSQGLASILVFGGYDHDQFSDYNDLKTKIKKFYGLRSKIVHHAEYTQIDEVLLEELSFMVAWLIITMVSLLDRGYTMLSDIQEQAERLDKIQN